MLSQLTAFRSNGRFVFHSFARADELNAVRSCKCCSKSSTARRTRSRPSMPTSTPQSRRPPRLHDKEVARPYVFAHVCLIAKSYCAQAQPSLQLPQLAPQPQAEPPSTGPLNPLKRKSPGLDPALVPENTNPPAAPALSMNPAGNNPGPQPWPNASGSRATLTGGLAPGRVSGQCRSYICALLDACCS